MANQSSKDIEYWECNVNGCSKLGLLSGGGCGGVCKDRYCRNHAQDVAAHPCYGFLPYLNPDHDISVKFWAQTRNDVRNIDTSFIIEHAQSLRPGRTCTLQMDRDEMTLGEFNYHFLITFADGVKWLARLLMENGCSSRGSELICIKNTADTAQYLHDNGVAVANARLPPRQHDDAAQLPLIFVDFLKGAEYEPFSQRPHFDPPTDFELVAIRNLAEWNISVGDLVFDRVGSLYKDATGGIKVGPLVSMFPMSRTPPYHYGPYENTQDQYVKHFDLMMEQILAGDRSLATEAVRDYLIALELRTLVAGCEEMTKSPFYLKHPDEKGDHVFFDAEGGLTGVLDLDWYAVINPGKEVPLICRMSTTCPAEAFASPPMFCPRDFDSRLSSWEEALVDSYISHGRPDLAEHVKGSRKYHILKELRDIGRPELSGLHRARREFCLSDPGPMEEHASWDV